MRIGFDAKRAFFNHTGLGNYSRFFIKVLKQYYPDHEYLLYTPKYEPHPALESLVQAGGLQVRLPSSAVSSLKLNSFWRSFSLGNTLSQDRVQLYHGLSNELPLRASRKTATVVTIHDLLFIRYPDLYPTIDAKIYNRKFRHACKTADRIVAISEQTSQDIQEYFDTPAEKIRVVYQGVRAAFKADVAVEELQSIRHKYSLPERFLLFVGRIERRKNPKRIVEALRLLPEDVTLVLVGRPHAEYTKDILSYVRKHRLHRRVLLLKNVGQEDLPKLFKLALALVYPSLFEGFGIPIIEGLAAGVPVITSKGGVFPEAGGPGTLYIDPMQVGDLAEAVETLLEDDQLASRMVQQGKEYVTKFNDDQLAADMMAVYQELL